MKKKILCIVQARLNSERFKNKVIKKINGTSILEILLERLKFSKLIDETIVAIPSRDIKIINIIREKNKVFLGSEKNVLSRFYYAAKEHADTCIVTITSDSPLIDPKLIDKGIKNF